MRSWRSWCDQCFISCMLHEGVPVILRGLCIKLSTSLPVSWSWLELLHTITSCAKTVQPPTTKTLCIFSSFWSIFEAAMHSARLFDSRNKFYWKKKTIKLVLAFQFVDSLIVKYIYFKSHNKMKNNDATNLNYLKKWRSFIEFNYQFFPEFS